jgi:hypothetical protein
MVRLKFLFVFQSSMFDPTSYRSVHNLATNTDKRQFEDIIKKTAEAIFMAKVSITICAPSKVSNKKIACFLGCLFTVK